MSEDTKRVYVRRKEEFYDMTSDHLRDVILPETKATLQVVKASLLSQPASDVLSSKRKELTNKITRIYNRMRALGYNSKQIRSENAAKKKEV